MDRGAYYGASYDRYLQRTEDSTSHKLKNAYWTTKQVVIQKLGRKEDEHVVASDSELDSKLELFKSVQRSCLDLLRVIERYQEKLCALSQAENEMGRFLKNRSSQDKTRAGKMMAAVGKSLSFAAQQRLALRVPLARLQQEVETFRYRAISDTLLTIQRMEATRTDYRGALLWMKDVSEVLDPDTYKQLDKFRKVQAQVRKTKNKFDKFKLDSMQKIDLLVASRCNMFSHVLALYQNTLLHFWEKTCRTMVAVADSFKGHQYYEFSMLKDLTDESRKLAESTGKGVDPSPDDATLGLDDGEYSEEEGGSTNGNGPMKCRDNRRRHSSSSTSSQLLGRPGTTPPPVTDLIGLDEMTGNAPTAGGNESGGSAAPLGDDVDELERRLDEIFMKEYKDEPESEAFNAAMAAGAKMSQKKKDPQDKSSDEQQGDLIGSGLDEMETDEDRAFIEDLLSGGTGPSMRMGGPGAPAGLVGPFMGASASLGWPPNEVGSGRSMMKPGASMTTGEYLPPPLEEDSFTREWNSVFGAASGPGLLPSQMATTGGSGVGSDFGGAGVGSDAINWLSADEQSESGANNLADFMPSALLDRSGGAPFTLQGAGAGSTLASPRAGGSSTTTALNWSSQTAGQGVGRAPGVGAGPGQDKKKLEKTDMTAWLSLFADLDPLANPDKLSKKEGQISDA